MTAMATIMIDGEVVSVETGLPLGAILHARNGGVLRQTARSGRPRGLFCAMGVCFDCLVTVDGRAGVRACITPVSSGMRIETRAS